MKHLDKNESERVFTDQEINEVAEWFQSLSFEEILVLKELYESLKNTVQFPMDGAYVH